ncbi:hypothetical protein SH467x_003993 [Pirellulaceae bacterium SH467]
MVQSIRDVGSHWAFDVPAGHKGRSKCAEATQRADDTLGGMPHFAFLRFVIYGEYR